MSDLIDRLPLPAGVKSILRWASNGYSTAKVGRIPVYVLLMGVLCVGVLEGSYYAEHTLIKTVTEDSAPSVELFHTMAAHFARMGEDFLVERNGKPGENFDQTKDFDTANALLVQAKIEATRNITYCDKAKAAVLHPNAPEGECGVIKKLESDRDRLMEVVTTARIYHERGDAAALAESREAYRLIVKDLIADCELGAEVNMAYLNEAYGQRHHLYNEVWYVDMGTAAFFGLVMLSGMYFVVFRRFQRGINVYFLAGFLVAGYGFYDAVTSFGTATAQLEQFKEGSFDSINPLTDAKANIYQARAIQALMLLDRSNTGQAQQELDAVMARIAKLNNGKTIEDVIAATADGYNRASCVPVKKQATLVWPVTQDLMVGGLATELNNLTWCHEYESATSTMRAFAQWSTVWTQVQQLNAQGQHDRAVKLFSGTGPGEGGDLLARLVDEDQTLGNLGMIIQINKDAAQESHDAAFGAIKHIPWRVPATWGIVWLLVVFGAYRQRASADPARAARRRISYSA